MIDAPPRPEDPATEPRKKGRLKRMLLPLAMRYELVRRLVGIHVVYRSNSGGLIVGGLAYAALFALIPTIVLVVVGVFLIVDDPEFRQQALELIQKAFPAFSGLTDQAVQSAREAVAVGGLIAIIGFLWGASGLYLNLTRAMERFFPGERVSGSVARLAGVLLVVVIIIGVLAAVFVAGVLTVMAEALELDAEWVLTAAGIAVTLVLATGIVYGVYRVIPANPPAARSARLPAVLGGIAIALMTLLFGLISPWLVSGFHGFGVVASVFVALIWLRVVFLAMVYGAAMARYQDFVAAAEILGECEPDAYATRFAMAEETDRATREVEAMRELERLRGTGEPAPSELGQEAAAGQESDRAD